MSAADLAGVLEAARARPAQSAGNGRAIMFIAARRGEGVSTTTAEAVRAAGANTVYGIDLDLYRNSLARRFGVEAKLGPRIEATLGGFSFYQIVSANGQPWIEYKPAYAFHRIGRSRAFVGVFDGREIPQGGRVKISDARDYWDAARAGGAMALVDAPALERSRVGLRIARHMDGVVLVVGADAGAAPAALAAKADILHAGGHLLGIVYAGASAPALIMHRLLSQAG